LSKEIFKMLSHWPLSWWLVPSLLKITQPLQYCTITCPDICFLVNKVCQFMAQLNLIGNLSKGYWDTSKVKISWGLHLQLNPSSILILKAYCDADWGSDRDDGRSTSGAYVFLGPNSVSWCWWAKKRPVVSRSSTEVEYKSMALATAELFPEQSIWSLTCVLLQKMLYKSCSVWFMFQATSGMQVSWLRQVELEGEY
jgi:hypothetical protein